MESAERERWTTSTYITGTIDIGRSSAEWEGDGERDPDGQRGGDYWRGWYR